MKPPLSYAEAAEQVRLYSAALAAARSKEGPDAEMIPLGNAAGRVLAGLIRADRDQPPWPRSTRDGFACRAAEAHQRLRIAGELRAGQPPVAGLGLGEAWEIMTGAPVPQGADAVFMVEHAESESGFVQLAPSRSVAAGENIVPQGAEARAGQVLMPSGIRMAAAQIALAAQCGCHELAVYRQPRVAILSTGDELVPVEATPGASQIRNSNGPMLAALVAAAGGEPIAFPAVADREAALDHALHDALALKPDLLLVTGGISAGRFDLVQDALTRLGACFHFQGVAMQPGKPVAFGSLPVAERRDLPFLALPGNPISSAVTFRLFAAPLLNALSGDLAARPRFALAKLSADWRGKPGLTRFLPAQCSFALDAEVQLVPWQGSGDLTALGRSNCFLFVPPDAETILAGSLTPILL